jgi:BirA family biotin operon repressor/biotin-[acetyl-CoA-carboxylase] ligase
MLQALAPAVQGWLDAWRGGAGFAQVRTAWLERAGPIGEPVAVDTGRGRTEGAFVGLDADGALLLRDAQGQERRVTYGDVTLAEPARERHG